MRSSLRMVRHFYCLMLAASLLPFVSFSQVQNAKQKLNDYLSRNASRLKLQSRDYAELFVTSSYNDATSGIQHVYAQQRFNGIDVVGGMFALHSSTKANKEYEADNLFKSSEFAIASSTSSITAEQAVRNALNEGHYPANIPLRVKEATTTKVIFERSDNPAFNIPARKVFLPDAKQKKLQLAWEVQMFDAVDEHYWIIYVDALTGKVIRKKDAIIHCTYKNPNYATDKKGEVFNSFSNAQPQQLKKEKTVNPYSFFTGANNQYRVFSEPYEAPNKPGATHTLVTQTGDPLSSPDGWHRVDSIHIGSQVNVAYNYTRGNNVWSFQDPSPGPLGGVPSADPTRTAYANNGPGGTPPLIEPFGFDYPFDATTDPSNSQKAAIVNLFYWNNLLHDVFYHFGFDENLNFQHSHLFSTGMRGPADGNGQGDEVLAQAQDGGGTNNANFLTLPDGTPGGGQMQMYLWTTAMPDQLVQISSSTSGTPGAGTKYTAVQGSFSNLPTANNDLYNNPVLNKEIVLVQKNPLSTVGSNTEGCTTGQQSIALPPGNDVNGKIVVIDRGKCSFVEKVLGAQEGGAAGVIIVNNVDGPPLAMGGSDAPTNAITIPAVMISKADGAVLKAQLNGGATIIGSLKKDTPNPPKRDGDFDNGVISHEYGHGISNRFTGGGDVLLPLGGDEQGGEGWSDFIALYMTLRNSDLGASTPGHPNGTLPVKGIGTYVVYQNTNEGGIRPTPYNIDKSAVPYSFKDIGKGGEITVPHGVGYIWCQMMYSMEQELIDLYGFNDDINNAANPVSGNVPAGAGGNNVAMRLISEGMKLQPLDPTFVQQRDAILKADTLLYNAQHSCRIWKAFAQWGLGTDAQSNTSGLGDEVEDYHVPYSCDPSQVNISMSLSAADKVINGSNITYTIKVKNNYPVTAQYVLTTDKLPSNTIYVSSSPSGTSSSGTVSWPVTSFAAGEEKTFTVTTQVVTPTASTQLFGDDQEDGEGGWTKSSATTDNWVISTAKPYSGTQSWFAVDVDGVSNMSLQTTNPVSIPAGGAELVFFHQYSTEKGFDGGVIEISTDGSSWTYLPPNKFVRNGYNAIIPLVNNPLIGGNNVFAFTGTSPGYLLSIASLSDYAGQNIFIRFRMTSDVGTAIDGWYLDDVYVLVNRTEIVNLAFGKGSSNAGFAAPVDLDSASKTTLVFGIASAPLPAILTDLKAKAETNSIRLDWSTLQETDVDKFVIERQAQNETDFTTVGSAPSRGNSNSRRDYQFTDRNVQKNILYSYRIKMLNRDGSVKFTNIATAKIGNGNPFGFAIAPNPAANNIKLTFNNPLGKDAMLRIYDVSGKYLASLALGNVNSASTTINISAFNNGAYWIELSDNGLKQTRKLVIQR